MNNFEKIKAAKTIDELTINLLYLLYDFATTKNIMSNDDLKQWLQKEAE
jgi:hypothetical protein